MSDIHAIKSAIMSFDGSKVAGAEGSLQKYPLRRLEPSIQKFLKVLEIDLDRLHRHRLNIEKLIIQENWKGLNKEQINASRTVQQIKANIREIEQARRQTVDEDVQKFDEKVESMKDKAVRSLEGFMTDTIIPNSDSSSSSPSTPPPSIDVVSTSLPTHLENHQIQLHVVPQESEAAASWESLQENLVELNEIIHDFASHVEGQQEAVDRIEDNIDKSKADVGQGVLSLGKASKYKAVVLPVAGAVLGGVIAGPLGFVAGAKIGGLAGAATGGLAGFVSGRLIKKRQDKVTEVEMSNLSERRSASASDLHEDEEDTSALSSMMPWNWNQPSKSSAAAKGD